jgi:hypothetical protein
MVEMKVELKVRTVNLVSRYLTALIPGITASIKYARKNKLDETV